MTEEYVKTKTFCPECGEEFPASTRIDECPKDGARLQEMEVPAADEKDPLLGVELDGRFELQSILGEGGMGRVYRGTQLSVEREVAVKVLRGELSQDEEVVKRFFREARVISSFAHPNIVNLVDFGQDSKEGVLYLAMEFIDGHPLGEILERGRMKFPLVVEIGTQVCAALSDPHDRDIVHRDLKPENLMLVPLSDGRIQTKVVDFGIAHTLEQNQNLTQTGAVHGTPYYMAPEQARGEEVTPATDLYALGVILFEMIAGTPPFDADTSMKLMFKHIEDEPPPILEFVNPNEVPTALIQLIDELMAKDPDQRPASALDVRERLQEISRDERLESVMLDTTLPRDELYDEWIVPRSEPVNRPGSGSGPPQTGSGKQRPSTDEMGEAETLTPDEAGVAAGPSDQSDTGPQAENRRASADAEDLSGTRRASQVQSTEQRQASTGTSPLIWVVTGGLLVLISAVVAVGTVIALTKWNPFGMSSERASASTVDAGQRVVASNESDDVGAKAPAAAGPSDDTGTATAARDDEDVTGGEKPDDRERAHGRPDDQRGGGRSGAEDDSTPSQEGGAEDSVAEREPEPSGSDDPEAPEKSDESDESESAAESKEERSATGDSEEIADKEKSTDEPSSGTDKRDESEKSDDGDIAAPSFMGGDSDDSGGDDSSEDESGESGSGFQPVE